MKTAIVVLLLLLTACGDGPAPKPTVPAWAKVAPEQIGALERFGVPISRGVVRYEYVPGFSRVGCKAYVTLTAAGAADVEVRHRVRGSDAVSRSAGRWRVSDGLLLLETVSAEDGDPISYAASSDGGPIRFNVRAMSGHDLTDAHVRDRIEEAPSARASLVPLRLVSPLPEPGERGR